MSTTVFKAHIDRRIHDIVMTSRRHLNTCTGGAVLVSLKPWRARAYLGDWGYATVGFRDNDPGVNGLAPLKLMASALFHSKLMQEKVT